MKPCPQCGAVGTVEIHPTLTARPLGSHSLSGNQIKFSAIAGAVLSCQECTLRVFGRIEGEHFVADATRAPTADEGTD